MAADDLTIATEKVTSESIDSMAAHGGGRLAVSCGLFWCQLIIHQTWDSFAGGREIFGCVAAVVHDCAFSMVFAQGTMGRVRKNELPGKNELSGLTDYAVGHG